MPRFDKIADVSKDVIVVVLSFPKLSPYRHHCHYKMKERSDEPKICQLALARALIKDLPSNPQPNYRKVLERQLEILLSQSRFQTP